MENTVVTTLNFNKACRACLNEGEEMHSIFSEFIPEDNLEQEQTTYLYEILMNISSMRILADDGLPTLICTNCMDLAHTAYRFQQQCNRTQAILEAYVSQIPCDEDDENCSQINMMDIDSHQVDNKEDLLETLNSDSASPTNQEQEIEIDNAVLKTESHDTSETKSFLKNSFVPCEDNSSSESTIFIKQESHSKVLDTSKIAAAEESIKLPQTFVLKRTRSDSTHNNPRKSEPRLNFGYYIKETVDGEKVYACNMCDRCYKYSSSLKIHMRTHTLEKPYVCKICGKDYKQYTSLMYHKRTHTGEQPYSCTICFKKYKQSGSLTAHMRVHTGQRPFLCSVCGRGFRQAPDLGYHMRTHTKEKPYMCNVCGKTMSMQCHLVQHMRTHTGERPFKCSECNKAFPSTTRLKRHAIIHTGLKPFSCEVCAKSFNRRSSLRVHAKIHTDERPHVCPVCGKGFIQAHTLRGHVLTHSSEQYELKA